MNKEVNEKKKRYAIIISFLVLMICITGGTYAYFALTASNNSVTGTVGGASLNLQVTKIYPTNEHDSKNMIPQLESTLDEAISLEHKCVDGNGNVICQVYSATVTNQGSTSSVLNGTISFDLPEREAGLYDDNWNLLASWDELVDDYGLKIEESGYNQTYSLSYIIRNNSKFSSVMKIIVDDNVDYIGYEQFEKLDNITEIAVPNVVDFGNSYEFGNLVSLKVVYYSGTDSKAPGVSSNTTIKPRYAADKLANLKWMRINDSNTLGTYNSFYALTEKSFFEKGKSFDANSSQTYYFVFWIDETGEVQFDNGTFRANIEFDSSTGGLTSTVTPLLSKHIESLYNDGSEINQVRIADNADKQLVKLNSNQKLMMIDQGDIYGTEYRFYGAEPDNYVEYNGELWRIISSSKVFFSETDATGETRVRIIKDTSIGNYAWDYTNSNNWANATLMCQLNTMYYNDSITACDGKSLTSLTTSLNEEARSLIDNALWYLGGDSNVVEVYADDYYTMERGTNVYEGNPTRWIGKIGIMYPSDYAYAADLSKCTKSGHNYMDWNSWDPEPNCGGTDWLFNSDYQWLIFPNSEDSYMALYVREGGAIDNSIDGGGGVYDYLGVRPVVVLKPNVKVTGGNGTSGNPYRLELSE